MLTFPGVKADEPIAQAAAQRDQGRPRRRVSARRWWSRPIRCGPTIRGIENMTTSYTRALAELVPVFFPDLLYPC